MLQQNFFNKNANIEPKQKHHNLKSFRLRKMRKGKWFKHRFFFAVNISFEGNWWEGPWRCKNKNKVMKNFLRREFLLKRLGGRVSEEVKTKIKQWKTFLKREFLLKRIGGRVSGEVKTDEGKTSPLISVKQLPRSSRVNLKQQSNIWEEKKTDII